METTGSKYLFPAYQSHKSESRHSETSRERSRTLPGYKRAATLRKKKERQKSILKKKREEEECKKEGEVKKAKKLKVDGEDGTNVISKEKLRKILNDSRKGFDPTQEEMAFGFIPISFSPIERHNEPNLEKLRTEEDK